MRHAVFKEKLLVAEFPNIENNFFTIKIFFPKKLLIVCGMGVIRPCIESAIDRSKCIENISWVALLLNDRYLTQQYL